MTVPQPIEAYNALVEQGEIRADPIQAAAMAKLQTLAGELFDYAEQMGKTGWRARLSFGGGKK
ncbi:MAG: hypothetical protein HOH04_07270, partial [Rhodospirillaceae bacterium]|nr:hypothetical protein [Rhodospirillaceae bacterium]